MRNRLPILFWLCTLFIGYHANCQIPYKNDEDLFTVKPVISLPSIQEKKIDIPKSYVEIEVQNAIEKAKEGQYRESINILNHLRSEVNNPYFIEFYLGLIFIENGQFPLAAQHMQKALAYNEMFLDGRFYLGLAQLNMGQTSEATEAFESLDLEAYEYLGVFGKGLIALSKGKLNDAEKLFRKSVKINPDFLPSIDELARINLEKGYSKKAKDWIQMGLDKDPEWITGQLYLITMDLQNGSTSDNTIKLLEQFLAKDPDNIQYLFLKATHYLITENYREAVESFVPAFISLTRHDQREINSEIHDQIENIKLALMYYQRHLPDNASDLKLMDEAICSFIIGDAKAIDLLKKLSISKIDNRSMMQTMFGIIFKNFAQDAEAVDILGEAILSDSSNWAAHLIRGKLFYKYNYPDYAIQDISMARFLQPKLKEVYSVQGKIYYLDQEYMSAYKSFSKVIAIDDQDIFISNLRGEIALNLGAYQEAAIDFNRIINRDPFNSGAYFNLYESYRNIGDTSLTMLYLDTASMYSVNNDKVHHELIRMGKLLNLEQHVETGYQRLVDYSPLNVANKLERGKYFFERGKLQSALEDFEKGIIISKSLKRDEYLDELVNWMKKTQKAIKNGG